MNGDSTLTPPIALDAIFRRNVQARPSAVAVAEFGGTGVRELSYAALNDDVNAIAAQIASFQLEQPRNIALLLPNSVEMVTALLAVMRAGHCAVPMPVLWRKSDLVRALRECEASSLITTANFSHENLPALAAAAASEVFELSFPCAFGENLPDGIHLLTFEAAKQAIENLRAPEQAVIATFGTRPDGIEFFPRTDAQWLAAGLSPLLTADIRQGDSIVSAVPLTSLAGIAAAFVPWLLTGGTLRLCADMPDGAALPAEQRTHLLTHARVLPAVAIALDISFASCLGLHAGGAAEVNFSTINSDRRSDLYSFGEHAVFAMLRKDTSQCSPLQTGEHAAGNGPVTLEVSRDAQVALRVRGPQVCTKDDGIGWRDTGLEMQVVPNGGFLPTAAHGVISMGGLLFGANDLERRILKAVPDAKIAQTTNPLLGSRIAIWSAQPDHAVRALLDAGLPRIIAHAVLEGERSHAAG